MAALIFLSLLAVIIFSLYKIFSPSGSVPSSSQKSESSKKAFVPDRDPKFMEWNIEHDADITGYNIAGINFRNLDYTFVGEFNGYLKLEENNQYDPNAVAIYKGRKKVGYIPKDYSKYIHDKLVPLGGKTTCIGYIYTFLDEHFHDKFAGMVIPDIEIPDTVKVIGPSQDAEGQ